MVGIEPQLLTLLNGWFHRKPGMSKSQKTTLYFSIRANISHYVHTQQMGVVEQEIYTISDDRMLSLLRGIGMPGRLNLILAKQELTIMGNAGMSPRKISKLPGAVASDGTVSGPLY